MTMDYEGRLKRLKEKMREKKIALMYLRRGANLFYLTGIKRKGPELTDTNSYGDYIHGAYISQSGTITLIGPRMGGSSWQKQAEGKSWITEVIILDESERPKEVLTRLLRSHNLRGKRIAIEERAWGAGSPGARHQGAEVPIREEVEELSIGVPGGREAVGAVAGDQGSSAVFGPKQFDLIEGVQRFFLEREPTAVRRPAHAPQALPALRNPDLLPGLHVQDPEVGVVVGVGNPPPVRRRMALEPEDGPIGGEGPLFSHPGGGKGDPFELPRLVREGEELLTIRHEGDVPIPNTGAAPL